MKTVQAFKVACLAGGLIAFAGLPAVAQHSSGGTSPSVTEGKQGESDSKGGKGVPGSGWNYDKDGKPMSSGSGSNKGTGSGHDNTGSGGNSGAHGASTSGGGHSSSGGGQSSGGSGGGGK